MTDRIAEIKKRWNNASQVEENPGFAFGDIKTLLSQIDRLQAEREAAISEVDRLKEAIKIKGGTEHAPTEDAYMAVCKALEKTRAERDEWKSKYEQFLVEYQKRCLRGSQEGK